MKTHRSTQAALAVGLLALVPSCLSGPPARSDLTHLAAPEPSSAQAPRQLCPEQKFLERAFIVLLQELTKVPIG